MQVSAILACSETFLWENINAEQFEKFGLFLNNVNIPLTQKSLQLSCSPFPSVYYRPFLLDFPHCQLKLLKTKNERVKTISGVVGVMAGREGEFTTTALKPELPLRWRQSVSSMWLKMWAVVSRSLFTRVIALTLRLMHFQRLCEPRTCSQ